MNTKQKKARLRMIRMGPVLRAREERRKEQERIRLEKLKDTPLTATDSW